MLFYTSALLCILRGGFATFHKHWLCFHSNDGLTCCCTSDKEACRATQEVKCSKLYVALLLTTVMWLSASATFAADLPCCPLYIDEIMPNLELLLKKLPSESILGFIIKIKNQVFNRMKLVDSEHKLALKYLLANSCVIPSCEDSRWRLLEVSGIGICSCCSTCIWERQWILSPRITWALQVTKFFKTWTKTGKKDFFLAGTDFCVFSGHLVFSSSHPCLCSSHRGSKLARIQQWNGQCVLRSVLIASCSFIMSIPNLKTDLTLPNCSAYFFPWIFWQTYLIWLGQASFLVVCQRVEWQLSLY